MSVHSRKKTDVNVQLPLPMALSSWGIIISGQMEEEFKLV